MNAASEGNSGGKMGMWLFCATEMILFGGLFLLYAMYRFKNPASFHAASAELSRPLGSLNTCILLTSSFMAALSVLSLRRDNRTHAGFYLLATIGLAAAFLAVKGCEWAAKFHHGLYPNSPELLLKPKGVILYFGLYFTMTGLHALHVIIGIGILSVICAWILRGKVTAKRPILLENAILYWSVVDAIWLFLFPLFYLVS
jgi:cytochrome c oxidase subunit 3